MKKEELTKLIEDAMKGDAAAFEMVMSHKAKQIVYAAVALMKDPQDGEDAAQEAMLKMYRHLNELKDPEAFQRWMYQIVTRTCIDLKRKYIRDDYDYLELEDEVEEMRREFLPQDYIEDLDKREFLLSVINDLPENYRVGLLLFYYEDMSYQQIAELMGISEKTVDNILQRGRKKIKEKLERRYGEGMKLLAMNSLAVPVLSQAFHMDAVMRTSPDAAVRVMAHVSQQLAEVAAAVGTTSASGAAGSAGAGSAATESVASGAAASPSASVSAGTTAFSAKSLAAAAAALTVAAAGITATIFLGNDDPVPTEKLVQEEAVILTLEDMIGQDNADQLRAYVEGDGDWQQWDEFLEDISVEETAGIKTGTVQYTLYHLEKQDKQLMILEQRQGDSDDLAAVFRFTDSLEEQPREGELLRSMERWQP